MNVFIKSRIAGLGIFWRWGAHNSESSITSFILNCKPFGCRPPKMGRVDGGNESYNGAGQTTAGTVSDSY